VYESGRAASRSDLFSCAANPLPHAAFPSRSLSHSYSLSCSALDLTAVDPRQVFAQPIVFFCLEAISILLHLQTVVHSMHAFRQRIPSWVVARVLCMAPVATQGLNVSGPQLGTYQRQQSNSAAEVPGSVHMRTVGCRRGHDPDEVSRVRASCVRRVFYVVRRITRRGMGRHGKAVRINQCEEGKRKGKRAEVINGGASAEQQRSSRKFSDHCGDYASQYTMWEVRTGNRNNLAYSPSPEADLSLPCPGPAVPSCLHLKLRICGHLPLWQKVPGEKVGGASCSGFLCGC
jgi:hypothetical protein